MAISQADIATLLARCARHCCLCRQYVPLQIQIHHILEKKNGGTDHINNLIPICVSCHATVHSSSQMTRSVSAAELRLHRQNVFALVESGKLPAARPSSYLEMTEVASAILATLEENKARKKHVSVKSTEILIAAAVEDSAIKMAEYDEGYVNLKIGYQRLVIRKSEIYPYPDALHELIEDGLLTSSADGLRITDRGHAYISQLVTTTAKFVQKKVRCYQCGLHFIICTWEEKRHRRNTITCPECGQKNGHFSTWIQYSFGHIFQHVPGNAVQSD